MLLVRLNLALENARTRDDTRCVVELDLDFADGIQELARSLVDRTRKIKLVTIRAAFRAHYPDVLLDAVVKL